MTIECPSCKENLEVPSDIAEGQHVRCPSCQEKFAYSARKAVCPNCNAELVLPDVVEDGQRVRCPYCGGKFVCYYDQYELMHETEQQEMNCISDDRRPTVSSVRPPYLNGAKSRVGDGTRFARFMRSRNGLICACLIIVGSLVCAIATRVWSMSGNNDISKCVCSPEPKNAVTIEPERHERKLKRYADRIGHYTCSDKLDIDYDDRASDRGVFGFRWGEKPRLREYKAPCEVEYPVSFDMYNQVRLSYGHDGGLFSVTFHRPQMSRIPDYSASTRVLKKQLQDKFVQDACWPTFSVMIEVAEAFLDQKFQWVYVRDPVVGGSFVGRSEENSDGYFGILRMDITGENVQDRNTEQLFCIMRRGK